MEEFDNAIDPDNDISYRISNKGHEVMIVNEREIFQKRKIGKRTLNNNYGIECLVVMHLYLQVEMTLTLKQ